MHRHVLTQCATWIFCKTVQCRIDKCMPKDLVFVMLLWLFCVLKESKMASIEILILVVVCMYIGVVERCMKLMLNKM